MKNFVIILFIFALYTNVNAQKNIMAAEAVNIEFTTVSDNGQYSPHHVLAVWITDQSGNFVRTITKRAVNEGYYLFKWKLSSFGDIADAITGATITSHETHEYSWNCKNKDGAIVNDGNYSVNIEYADNDSQGPIAKIDFTKGDTSQITPADESYYKNMKVKYNSDISSVSEIDNINLNFVINPNPATNYLQVSVSNNNIYEIEIININGKTIFSGNNYNSNTRLDISEIETGVYFIFVKSNSKSGVQKILIK